MDVTLRRSNMYRRDFMYIILLKHTYSNHVVFNLYVSMFSTLYELMQTWWINFKKPRINCKITRLNNKYKQGRDSRYSGML